MDEAVSAAEANRSFSSILRGVREGRSYLVTAHGKAVARIVPATGPDNAAVAARKTLLERLAQTPVMVVGKAWRRDDLYDD